MIFPQIQKFNHINQFISISWKSRFRLKFAKVAAVADNPHDCESTADTWRGCPAEESPNCLISNCLIALTMAASPVLHSGKIQD